MATIKSITPNDTSKIIQLVKKSAMFDEAGVEFIADTLEQYFAGNDEIWLGIDQPTVPGVIYARPEPLTAGTWNILMLVVDADHHGQGLGSALAQHLEQLLASNSKNRLLIVETSSLDEFKPACKFYHKIGFKEEARIKNFYDHNDHKIVFTKPLR